MYAVGKLGSYITQGVYTVSGPFHPFGGAVDIIVVEQQDGTFKSSPWYVRFGKFQGVLQSKEKVVDISVDGVQSDFHMYLDQRGQAYFVRELECEEGESLFYPSSSGEDADVAKPDRKPLKSKSCNYHSLPPDSVVGNGKMVIRTGSRRSRILGLVFGRNSMKENSFLEKKDGSGVVRADSLERAEMAADLLEMKWSTNLAFTRYKNDTLVNCDDSQVSVNNETSDETRNDHNETDNRSRLRFQILGNSDEDFGVEISSLENDEKGESCALDPLTSKEVDELVLANADDNENTNLFSSEIIKPALDFEVKSLNEINLVVAKQTLDSSASLVDNNIDESSSNVPTHVEISLNSSANAIVSVNLSDLKNSPTQETVMSVPVEKVNILSSQGLDEEILLFGEFDDPNYNKEICPESISLAQTVESNSSSDEKEVIEKHRVVSSSINIPKRNKFEGFERMAESLPIMWPLTGDVVLDSLQHPLAHSLDSNFEASKRIASLEDLASCVITEAEKDDEVANLSGEYSQMTEDVNNVPASTSVGDQSEVADLANGKWRVWPFSFRRSKSLNNTEKIETTKAVDAEINLESSISPEKEKVSFQPKAKKTKKVRVLTPTPEQLASLKLKDGMNRVAFTFSTSMLGPQQVDARIFLWKWDTRIVISDVDGTITKSDVLGQFMPMVGMDWSHSGVAHLFSAIKENGYQLLFLSARAISQAYHTRQFLFNLKQDGKALPDGPVVISPDGLFPSLFREVIRRAPHEFKIACLEDIKALFPSDRSPFYAGFGNRDTDEFSYLKVGIPIGKIFIINPKGEVVVNRRVDRKSYTSLKALVHDMFPPMSSSEQEDYNSWNFWKLPPPLIDM